MKIYLASALVAFAISLLFCFVLIPVLRRLKAGQNILSYVKEHKSKGGTPTMGGLAFILAAVLSAAIFIRRAETPVVICIAIGLAYMLIGLLDDFLKRKHKENLGLKAWQKLLFQTLVAVFAGIFCFRAGLTELELPFLSRRLDIGVWVLPLSVFVFIATVNAVNLTDGLDGLAAGTSVPFFAVLGMLIALQGGFSSLSVLCFALTGALIAYLLFNVFPASVFMGDTGSLSLGGFAAAIAVLTGNALYIAVLGICFVFSVISVLIQVIYYKATGGKRVFLMAPVHHHFQEKGFSESRISYAYFTVTLVLGGLCVLTAL
ncbi:MAG: phospho-N-acetylmuramoyl-pentapeptide-transferase [Clostridia bacterium]|nr:phospho-N-acetylmuramoyl-pentapeptide-transferase [Clostridia bacterium]